MSDFGAEVIKIEPPGMGDAYRRRAIPNAKNPLNPGFFFDTRNKKSLALDLRTAAGRAVLYRLVKDADVFITNFGTNALFHNNGDGKSTNVIKEAGREGGNWSTG